MTDATCQNDTPNLRVWMVDRPAMLESSADGWRGRIGAEFTPSRALAIVHAIIEQHEEEQGQKPSRVLVGFDCRHLSEEVAQLAAAMIQMRSLGHEVTLVRHLPTSTASFLVSGDHDIAVLVTASHNPSNWNGIKVKLAPGISAPQPFVHQVDARVEHASALPVDPAVRSIPVQEADRFLDIHANAVATALPSATQKPLRVAIDGLGGIGETALCKLGALLGWQVLPSGRKIDTTLCNQVPDPSKAKALADLCHRVRLEKADFGLALDGDGDRIFAVTQEGEIVTSHDLMAVLILHEKHGGKPLGRIAVTQSTGMSVRRAAEEIGAEIVETPIGFKYISQMLSDETVDAGVGSVGDMAFRARTLDRDPLFIAAQLSQLLNQSDLPLSVQINRIRLRLGTAGLNWIEQHFPEGKATHPEDLETILEQTAPTAGIAPLGFERLSGGAVRLRCASGAWMMLRPSTTEGGLRLYSELLSPGANSDAIRSAIERSLNILKQGRTT